MRVPLYIYRHTCVHVFMNNTCTHVHAFTFNYIELYISRQYRYISFLYEHVHIVLSSLSFVTVLASPVLQGEKGFVGRKGEKGSKGDMGEGGDPGDNVCTQGRIFCHHVYSSSLPPSLPPSPYSLSLLKALSSSSSPRYIASNWSSLLLWSPSVSPS